MKAEQFNAVVEDQIQRSRTLLTEKSTAYNTDDRLSAFKIAATLQGITPKEALAGMMAKHTGSIYKMCSKEGPYTVEQWNEKITDHINYLLNLRAIIEEEAASGLFYFGPDADEVKPEEIVIGKMTPTPHGFRVT